MKAPCQRPRRELDAILGRHSRRHRGKRDRHSPRHRGDPPHRRLRRRRLQGSLPGCVDQPAGAEEGHHEQPAQGAGQAQGEAPLAEAETEGDPFVDRTALEACSQSLAQLHGRSEAVLRSGSETAGAELDERVREPGAEILHGTHDARPRQLEKLVLIGRQIRRTTAEKLVEHRADAEDVARSTDPVSLTTRLLRSHVGERSGDGRRARSANGLGKPEVDESRHAVVTDDDIRGLDVAVEHAAGVNGRETVHHLSDDLDRAPQPEPPGGFRLQLDERSARHVLQHEVRHALEVLGSEALRDVRALHPRQRPAFPAHLVDAVRRRAMVDLQDNETFEVRVDREVGASLSALAEDLPHLVLADLAADDGGRHAPRGNTALGTSSLAIQSISIQGLAIQSLAIQSISIQGLAADEEGTFRHKIGRLAVPPRTRAFVQADLRDRARSIEGCGKLDARRGVRSALPRSRGHTDGLHGILPGRRTQTRRRNKRCHGMPYHPGSSAGAARRTPAGWASDCHSSGTLQTVQNAKRSSVFAAHDKFRPAIPRLVATGRYNAVTNSVATREPRSTKVPAGSAPATSLHGRPPRGSRARDAGPTGQ